MLSTVSYFSKIWARTLTYQVCSIQCNNFFEIYWVVESYCCRKTIIFGEKLSMWHNYVILIKIWIEFWNLCLRTWSSLSLLKYCWVWLIFRKKAIDQKEISISNIWHFWSSESYQRFWKFLQNPRETLGAPMVMLWIQCKTFNKSFDSLKNISCIFFFFH